MFVICVELLMCWVSRFPWNFDNHFLPLQIFVVIRELCPSYTLTFHVVRISVLKASLPISDGTMFTMTSRRRDWAMLPRLASSFMMIQGSEDIETLETNQSTITTLFSFPCTESVVVI